MEEHRTFLLCDDNSENYFVGRFTRTKEQVKPKVWELQIGDYLQGLTKHTGIIREI